MNDLNKYTDRQQIEYELRELRTSLIRMEEKINQLNQETRNLKEEFIKYVTKHEFAPVKLIVFGMAGTVLTSALVLILSTVLAPAGGG